EKVPKQFSGSRIVFHDQGSWPHLRKCVAKRSRDQVNQKTNQKPETRNQKPEESTLMATPLVSSFWFLVSGLPLSAARRKPPPARPPGQCSPSPAAGRNDPRQAAMRSRPMPRARSRQRRRASRT